MRGSLTLQAIPQLDSMLGRMKVASRATAMPSSPDGTAETAVAACVALVVILVLLAMLMKHEMAHARKAAAKAATALAETEKALAETEKARFHATRCLQQREGFQALLLQRHSTYELDAKIKLEVERDAKEEAQALLATALEASEIAKAEAELAKAQSALAKKHHEQALANLAEAHAAAVAEATAAALEEAKAETEALVVTQVRAAQVAIAAKETLECELTAAKETIEALVLRLREDESSPPRAMSRFTVKDVRDSTTTTSATSATSRRRLQFTDRSFSFPARLCVYEGKALGEEERKASELRVYEQLAEADHVQARAESWVARLEAQD